MRDAGRAVGGIISERADAAVAVCVLVRRLATLKRAMFYRTCFASRSEARLAIFTWIATWSNRKRRHSSLGYMSPEAFERQYQQEQQQGMAA